MMEHPVALQLRSLRTLVEIAVDKNSTVVFPAPLMNTIAELGTFLAQESAVTHEPMPSGAELQPLSVVGPRNSGGPHGP
jgi:hypothetical protein